MTNAPDPLLAWRDEFPILRESNYLVSNSLGAMPRKVYDSLHSYAETWASRGVRAWGEGWWDMNTETGDKIAPIIGAPVGTVTMHQNISLALGVLLSAFDLNTPARRKVVITDMIFPSVHYVLESMITPALELVTVHSDDGIGVDVEKIVDAIDEDTYFVCIDHVFFRTAYILDVQRVIEKAHRVGAFVILDAYHSAGIVPLDVTALDVDFCMAGVLKWMCGGPGGVFLYVRPDWLRTLRPKLTGWMAHQRPFGFELELEYRDDAFRFLNGTPAVASLYAIQPGIEIIAQVGVDNIRAKSLRQTRLLIELADAAGYTVNSPREDARRGGTVVLDPPHSYEVSRELIMRNIVIDYRAGSGIRISPHFYNTDDEVRACIDAIRDILATDAWGRHANNRAFVT
jgi:kynureninase